jgi:hypothetical protein
MKQKIVDFTIRDTSRQQIKSPHDYLVSKAVNDSMKIIYKFSQKKNARKGAPILYKHICSLSLTSIENGSITDRVIIPDLCPDSFRAYHIFRKICEGSVTPCAIFEVMDDLLAI